VRLAPRLGHVAELQGHLYARHRTEYAAPLWRCIATPELPCARASDRRFARPVLRHEHNPSGQDSRRRLPVFVEETSSRFAVALSDVRALAPSPNLAFPRRGTRRVDGLEPRAVQHGPRLGRASGTGSTGGPCRKASLLEHGSLEAIELPLQETCTRSRPLVGLKLVSSDLSRASLRSRLKFCAAAADIRIV
jgi:hypothetical protein